ncbi:MAG: class I SAM-dependent methyltransferase [Rhodoferax sp.]
MKTRIAEPFGLRQMAQLPRGLLVDVGCGNGEKLEIARQLGWQTLGLELDASAVQAARHRGLEIREGGFELLAQLGLQADCIVCSHVLEHVHQPLELLRLLRQALKPSGTLLLSTPNARSHLRSHYGPNWRGLEAPRHLAIPAQQWLVRTLEAQGFVCDPVASVDLECAVESERISRRSTSAQASDLMAARQVLEARRTVPLPESDAIQLVCRLGAESPAKP